MFYHVCIQNCLEDFYLEDSPTTRFDTLEEAELFVRQLPENENFYAFNVNGKIKWYFSGVQLDGELHDPDEDDVLECYQIIQIIPSEQETETLDNTFLEKDIRGVLNASRSYCINYRGLVTEVSELEFFNFDEEDG